MVLYSSLYHHIVDLSFFYIIFRKCGDRVRVFDESLTTTTLTDNNSSQLSDVTDITLLEERIKNLPFTSDDKQKQRHRRYANVSVVFFFILAFVA